MMKFNTLFAINVFIMTSQQTHLKASFEKVDLKPPLDWTAGESLFPFKVIAGYNANLSEYDHQTWADYVLGECKKYDSCTSCISNQATNSGSTGGRFWFGYSFSGGATSPADYKRNPDVTDSIAYTISGENSQVVEEI
ncbi:hypothetical protein F5B20DRAFT_594806 [Whalleya microplaca]|nr:hypothetical protein F5B20DRAFT_594806 [Whalleya microplaca]